MNGHLRWRWCWLLIVSACAVCRVTFGDKFPKRYPLSYPAAEQFCPPVDGFFDEVQRTIDRAGGRKFRHQPNGGYGLPIVDTVGGKNLLHLGADVGWYQVGAPVFAVANGIVRMSHGPLQLEKDKKTRAPSAQPSPKGRGSSSQPKILDWGNHIVIEHKLPDGKYATTVYGHLANERLVKVGDEVRAGQQIGSIGPTNVNGGYKPHLHLGVRDGRMAEVGRKLLLMMQDGERYVLEITEVREKTMVVKGGERLPDEMQMALDGPKFAVRKENGNAEIDLAFLYYVVSPEFLIVGYGLSTDGWRDPVAFLQVHQADTNPAAFTRGLRAKQSRTAVAKDRMKAGAAKQE